MDPLTEPSRLYLPRSIPRLVRRKGSSKLRRADLATEPELWESKGKAKVNDGNRIKNA